MNDGDGRKRRRTRSGQAADDDDKLGGPQRTEGLSIGEQTSGIKNKQKRSELLGKLKHKKKVRRWVRSTAAAAGAIRVVEAEGAAGKATALPFLRTPRLAQRARPRRRTDGGTAERGCLFGRREEWLC
jgi:hypothetical protein